MANQDQNQDTNFKTFETELKDEADIKRLVQDEAMRLPDMGIAVSGIAGRFPKSDSLNEFEHNLFNGLDMVNDNDDSRFSCALWGLPPRAGRLKDLSRFDSEFFGFTPEEANYIDFQMRILYEVVYESILDAGVNPASLRGTRTGVFFGLHCNEFENAMADDPAFKPNGYYAQFAVKVAQYFDLRGITITFDAACASGFVGLHNAVQALDQGLIEQAIVCSCNIPIHPTGSFIFLQMQMLSPTGYSRFLDSRADGYVKSEACVSVLLQRKHVALRNYASIMATQTSVDGFKKEGITFPSDKSQEDLIRESKQLANLSTNHVEYFEAHGTGTPAGDPQEARAIANVYFADNEERRTIGPLLVGSVKTNMGHSEAASGLCAMAKVMCMLENEVIYKGLHYDQPNANIKALKEGKLKFIDETTPLRAKIVPLSCYGFGGANVHCILRANERPTIPAGEIVANGVEGPRLIIMFGRSQSGLNHFFDQLMDGESRATRNCLSDDFLALINSLNADKIDRLMNWRGYLIVDRASRKELARGISKCELRPITGSSLDDRGRSIHLQEAQIRKCHLILPGIGSQWPKMAAGLRHFRDFWSTIEELALILTPHQIDLEQLLVGETEGRCSMAETFVSIVACELALIELVQNKLKLANMASIVGHSLGEVSCAFAANLITKGEAILVAYQMGKTLDDNMDKIRGKMVALAASEAEANKLIDGRSSVRVCCVNGADSVTLSGTSEDIDEFRGRNRNLGFFQVDIQAALHNELIMDQELRQRLAMELGKVLHRQGDTTQRWLASFQTEAAPATPEYFADCLCKPVKFLQATSKLEDDSIVLELGPSGIFGSQLQSMQQPNKRLHYVRLMARGTPAEEQVVKLLASIGQLYQDGAILDLNYFYGYTRDSSENRIRFPVRRQTPSLSSLFSWDHRATLFVPRYPIQFSKSSAKCEIPIDIVQDRDKFLLGHCIEGRVLYPATGYLYLVWRAFSFCSRKVYDSCFHDVENELVPIEFHKVRLLRAVILGSRTAQIYLHYEESTGRFEVKEGGSVCVEGYCRSPEENPDGLLYDVVRDRIIEENWELELNADDVYKQFRVSGYDYGETFRCIESSSANGRYCRVKHNGHFISLTDSILQSIFLAISQYAPSGGLFLPTRFDYVRFQPQQILKKIRDAKVVFDHSDGSLNTKTKREIMTKIMQREAAIAKGEEEPVAGAEDAEKVPEEQEQRAECIFDVYCDPVTGVIITDGIEMRGITATPAPRRLDTNEVLLESYQFVRDFETPIQDEPLTKFEQLNSAYVRACDEMSLILLEKLIPANGESERILSRLDGYPVSGRWTLSEVEAYKRQYLACVYETDAKNAAQIINAPDEEAAGQEVYDMEKNGDRVLMSVLDILLGTRVDKLREGEFIRKLVDANRLHLMSDLIQNSFTSERFMRSPVEMIIENSCTKKMKLRVIEVNVDDGLMRNNMSLLMQKIEPTLSLDYSLAHPNIERLKLNNQLQNAQSMKTYTLKSVASLFADSHLTNFDLVAYKDISCYSLPRQVIEQNGLLPVVSSLSGAVRVGGYVMIIMRSSLTLAERILLSLSEPELVGLSERHLRQIREQSAESIAAATAKINHINEILESRCKQMALEAEKSRMIHLIHKSDANGCSLLLFKRTGGDQTSEPEVEALAQTEAIVPEKILLRVTHNTLEIPKWLDELKLQFKKPPEEEDTEAKQAPVTPQIGAEEAKEAPPSQVWLCAVATKTEPINGLIGMIQALRKELGSSRLRCYYDEHTFRNCNDSEVTVSAIESCAKFQLSLQRDLIWNCVDSQGQLGSFRHFTINDYLSYKESNCGAPEQAMPDIKSSQSPYCEERPAFVNTANKGDLSSFTWFEAPHTYLDEEDRRNLVRIAYSALNFRDIMLATGRLPLDAISKRQALSDCLLGLEFSGYNSDGGRVMGMVAGKGLATHVVCPKDAAIKAEVPDWLELSDAATIPVVYATAIMALIYRGGMQRGESVLIHAGSGGVGQAAIRLAAHHGLEIFTTVGSDEKRQFLLEEFGDFLSEDRIFSSRTCEFEAHILQATRGRGVDLVLNSLAEDKLQASVNCLRDGGRFLEIGKYDLAVDARLELLKLETNKTFHGILLDKMFDVDEASPSFNRQLQCVMDTLKDGLLKGYVRPIKHKIFKRNQVEEAFRFMATGKHMGKVLIEINKEEPRQASRPLVRHCVPRFQVSPRKSYIVTGGLGGFGLELCKWLVGQGAKRVVITSRSGLRTGYQRATLRRLEQNESAKFLVIDSKTADSTTEAGVEELCRRAEGFAPSARIGAIFHLAMVLKDTMLENMSPEDFELVCKPKIATGEYLDRTSRKLAYPLDYFVAFSSVTSGKGNAGQSNYAYANSYLERLCERRRSAGLHGLAIQWGAIGDVGVAFENLGGNNVIIGGTIPQRMPSCLATLAKLLTAPFSTCMSVLPVSRSSEGIGEKGDLVGAIMHVLGIKDTSKVSEHATLGELGLDSLMAVEIRQYIEREYDKTLNIQEIRSLTIAKIRAISDQPKKAAASAAATSTKTETEEPAKDDSKKTKLVNGQEMQEVASYGMKLPQSSAQVSEAASQVAIEERAREMQQAAIDRMLNKSKVNAFVPELELPREDFVRLNEPKVANQLSNGFSQNGGSKSRLPLFFLPPIHGRFDKLQLICEHIERPCMGLNWTHKLGKAKTMREAIEVYVELLKEADWALEFGCVQVEWNERFVDLVGYSYGATVAFELMLALRKNQLIGTEKSGGLRAGRLVLLDGSPKQIELGSQLLSSLTEKRPLGQMEKLDEMLMVYVMAHTQNIAKRMDYLGFQRQLADAADLEAKVKFASVQLVEALKLDSNKAKGDNSSKEEARARLAQAMEAFCRRYDLINNYKTSNNLCDDCTLIRAKEIYLSSNEGKFDEDLDLSSVVEGSVNLYVMPGDHETFLARNCQQIARLISQHTR